MVVARRFTFGMVPEKVQPFWAALLAGESRRAAGELIGIDRGQARRIVHAESGIRPRRGRDLKGRCLSFAEREEIAVLVARGDSIRSIAAHLGRSPSTISRELARNRRWDGEYRATHAHAVAWCRASRPKPAKLHTNEILRCRVEGYLSKRYSPEQIAGRLRKEFPSDPEMWVSTETIYQSLYVQSRGALRRELTKCLRTGRTMRVQSRKAARRKGRIRDMVNISKRPAEAEDRAVPGHWEGDLILGKQHKSAMATLVERTTGYVMLAELPDGHSPPAVAEAVSKRIQTLPDDLRRSLTWDQGTEMRQHKQISISADIDIFFCDPHSPWQRAINENTNGLLRQYFPKSTDLSKYSQEDLDQVADELNDRPRKRLEFRKPIEDIKPLLLR